jgi:hypothetical protein
VNRLNKAVIVQFACERLSNLQNKVNSIALKKI